MIIIFSSSLGIMVLTYKKNQIKYIDSLLYIANRISLLLESTSPDTEEIMSILKSDKRLENFNFDIKNNNSPLPDEEKLKVSDLFNSIGKYDTKSQIKIIEEFSGYFKILKQEYQQHYNSHKKLYLLFGFFSGVFASILLI